MVLGINSFREKFKDYTDYYTIIGGTACDMQMGLPFDRDRGVELLKEIYL